MKNFLTYSITICVFLAIFTGLFQLGKYSLNKCVNNGGTVRSCANL